MNKQELIDKYEDKLKDIQLKFGANFKTKVYEGLVEDLQQLDEPQKVTVPQFVADWLDGYTVEKEPKYTVECKSTKQYLSNDELGPHFDPSFRSNFTKSDLEELGLGWVFDCEGMEVEEV